MTTETVNQPPSQNPTNSSANSKTITVVPNGDLTLILHPANKHPSLVSQLPHSNTSSPHDDKIRIVVSTGHLSLVSTRFRTLLDPTSHAGATLGATGETELDLENDDPEAMLLILHHIYGHHGYVPQEITLARLAEVCRLVNFYMLLEAMLPLCEVWYDALRCNGFYRTRDGLVCLIYWITIAHVLGKTQDLDELLLEGVVKCYGRLPHEIDYPMPHALISLVAERRAGYFAEVAALLDQLRADCKEMDTVGRVHECTSLLLEIVDNMVSDLSKMSVQASEALVDGLDDFRENMECSQTTEDGVLVPCQEPARAKIISEALQEAWSKCDRIRASEIYKERMSTFE